MPRALFEKTGNAVYISHLDLMRLFQRAFKRADLTLTHTQGYNPRPSVSIALPMSVGVESVCELLDFDLTGDPVSCEEILARLNRVLVGGVRVLNVYPDCRKIRDIAYLDCAVTMEYDAGIPIDAVERITELFSRDSLTVEKKGKNGVVKQDIIPLIRSFNLVCADNKSLILNARICCQNPALNPIQLVTAIEAYLPECAPDFTQCRRIEIYDAEESVFR